MWEELIPYLKISLIMFNLYILCRMFSREVVRLDVDKPIEVKI